VDTSVNITYHDAVSVEQRATEQAASEEKEDLQRPDPRDCRSARATQALAFVIFLKDALCPNKSASVFKWKSTTFRLQTHPKALTYPKVQERIPAHPAATDQALAPPSGNACCEDSSSDLVSRLASGSLGSSEDVLCSLRDAKFDATPEDMIEARVRRFVIRPALS